MIKQWYQIKDCGDVATLAHVDGNDYTLRFVDGDSDVYDISEIEPIEGDNLLEAVQGNLEYEEDMLINFQMYSHYWYEQQSIVKLWRQTLADF